MLERLQPRRLVLVDPDGEYSKWGDLVDHPRELAMRLALPEYRVRFRPDIDRARGEAQFAWLCSMVRWQVDPQPGQARPASTAPVLLVVDELADLVGPSFREAPASWRWCVRRGRKYGVSVMAASQRPEEIDKSFFAMPSHLVVHAIGDPDAAARLAKALTVKPAEVNALSGHAYIMRDRYTGKVTRS